MVEQFGGDKQQYDVAFKGLANQGANNCFLNVVI